MFVVVVIGQDNRPKGWIPGVILRAVFGPFETFQDGEKFRTSKLDTPEDGLTIKVQAGKEAV